MKRLCMLGCLALGVVASGRSAASTDRSAEGSGSGAVSSSSVGAAVGSPPVTATETGVSSVPASPAPTAQLSLPCGAFGLRIEELPSGEHVEHTEQDALRTAAAANVGPTSRVRVYAAWVQDPTADKVGLGDNAQFRVMWVLDGSDTIATPSPGMAHFPPSSAGAPTPGTVYRTITLVDDHSLTLGGNFDCGSTTTAISPANVSGMSPSPSVPTGCSIFDTTSADPNSRSASPPSAPTAVTATWRGTSPTASCTVTHGDSTFARTLLRDLDAAPSDFLGTRECPADFGRRIALTFTGSSQNGVVLISADGCPDIYLPAKNASVLTNNVIDDLEAIAPPAFAAVLKQDLSN